MVVEEKIILKLKASQQLTTEHDAQRLHYLRATDYEVGLLLNIGPRPEMHRKSTPTPKRSYTETADKTHQTRSDPL